MIRSGSICMSFLYRYLVTETEVNEKGGDELVKKGTKLKCLADTFSSYGGVLAKLSQLICLESQNNGVFSDCKPYSQKETIEYIKQYYNENPDFFKDIKEIDFNVFKSGSVGQVHRCITKDDKDIILKVQYVGLYEQFKNDIFILDMVTKYLFHFSDITNAMLDIKTKLYEELDYKIEYKNQDTIFNLWKEDDTIRIAELIPSLCTDNLLSMEYIDGESLNNFMENSTQEERNHIGKSIVNFIFKNLYQHNIFYSDIHYGNFLIKDKRYLYVTDFGCLHYMSDKLIKKLINLHKCILNDDKETFYIIVDDLGIIDNNISEKSKDYIYDYFRLQFEPWISESFEFTRDWLRQAEYKETELMKEWKLPSDMVYLNKINYAMYHVLTNLKLEGNFIEYFNELFKVI